MKIEEDAAAEAAATQLNAEKEAQILKMAADILGGDRSGAKAKTESEDENGNDVMEMKGEGAVVKTEEGQAKAKGEEKVEEMEKKADDEVLFANFTDFLEGEEKGENADEA